MTTRKFAIEKLQLKIGKLEAKRIRLQALNKLRGPESNYIDGSVQAYQDSITEIQKIRKFFS